MRTRISLPVAVLCLAFVTQPAGAQPAGLPIKAVPASANVIAIIDAEALLGSPIAAKAGWTGKTEERYRAGLGVVPPGTKRVLVAGDLNLASRAWAWKAALMQGERLPTLAEVAERERGEVDESAGVPVVLSPRGVYFAAPANGELAVFMPASRQALSRWAAHMREPGTGPSKFLAGAAKHAETHHVTMALDLSDSIDPAAAKESAAALFCVVKRKADAAAFGKFLAEAKGITLTAKATDSVRASLRIDFASNPLKYEHLIKEAFLEILDDQGAGIPEMDKWESSYGDRSYTMSGRLQPESLERILGLLSFPLAAGTNVEAAPTGPATRRYFDSVVGVVDDLRKLSKDPGYERTALWHETAARKIAYLNPRGVDPAAIAFGQDIEGRLLAIASSLRGVPIDVARLQQGAYAYAYSNPTLTFYGRPRVFGDRTSGFSTNLPQVRAEQNKAIADDLKKRQEIWTQIEDLLGQTRSKLAAQYPDF